MGYYELCQSHRPKKSDGDNSPNLEGEPDTSRRPVVLGQEAAFATAKKEEIAMKAMAYRTKRKAMELSLKKGTYLKWERFGGAKKICMRVHQYDLPELKRIVQLGTCPAARGSFIPTARIATHMTFH